MSKRAIERWRRLTVSGAGDGVIEVSSIDSGIATGFGTARYAIGAQGQPRLLVPIGGSINPRGLTSTPKLLVTTSNFKVAGKGTLFLDVMCQDRALDVVFAELAEEILRRIQEGHSPLKAVTASIDDFRELLKEKSPEKVPESKIQGLVGELEVLRRLTSYNKTAVKTWTGPYELRHDFRQGIHALEVKTSGRSNATHVTIHGADQLAAPIGGTLHLVHIRLERVENGQLSISTLFNSLLKLESDKGSLKASLDALGCPDPHAEEWNRLSYTLVGLKVYSVTKGFPRIIASSFNTGFLPQGISTLEYQIDLSHAKSCELSTTDCEIAFERIAG